MQNIKNKKTILLCITLFLVIIISSVFIYSQKNKKSNDNNNTINYKYKDIVIYQKDSEYLVGKLTVRNGVLTYKAEKNSIIGLYIKIRIKYWENATLSYDYEETDSDGKTNYYTAHIDKTDPRFLIPIFIELQDKFENQYDIHLK